MQISELGFKLAPVITFPGGFNNLSPAFLPLVHAAMVAEKISPRCPQPAPHPGKITRATFTICRTLPGFAHLLSLTGFERTHRDAFAGDRRAHPVDLPGGGTGTFRTLETGPYRLGLEGLDPGAILLNNDLGRIPPIPKTSTSNSSCPSSRRLGGAPQVPSLHRLCRSGEPSANIGIDPWRINPAFSVCRSVNFHERQGEEVSGGQRRRRP